MPILRGIVSPYTSDENIEQNIRLKALDIKITTVKAVASKFLDFPLQCMYLSRVRGKRTANELDINTCNRIFLRTL